MKRLLPWIPPLLAAALAGGCGGEREPEYPNIILFTLESLRADHVGAYGYPLPTTPNLDRFAAESIRFEDAHSVTSWTLPAHVAILTGQYPSACRVTEPDHRLSDSVETVAELLKAIRDAKFIGYETAAFVSGPFLRSSFNLDQGFEIYDDEAASTGEIAGHADVTNPAMEGKVIAFLRARHEKPFFLFAYFWDIHYDYIPPPPFDTLFVTDEMEPFDITRFEFNEEIRPGMSEARLRYLVSQYDGEIRCTDEMLGRILDVIREEGLWENSAIIITADHAEEFFDHGDRGHKNNLHAASVRVPLLIKPAGTFEPRVDPYPASIVDIRLVILSQLPTLMLEILERVGIGWIGGSRQQADGPRFFELDLPLHAYVEGQGIVGKRVDRWRGVRAGDYKYLELPRNDGARLYNVKDDPGETRDLSGESPELTDSLAGLIARWEEDMDKVAAETGAGEQVELTPEERARLEALGYVE